MNKDRQAIVKIMSKMFEKVDECGIYPTSICYDELEVYIEEVRFESAESVKEGEALLLRERLAALCHQQWSHWMKYLFSKCRERFMKGMRGLFLSLKMNRRNLS